MVQDARPAVPAEAPAPCPPDIDMLGTQEVQMGDPEKQPGPELERQTQKLRDHAVVRPQGGMPMRSSDLRSGEEAVVIGGSMAGLLAARVLADRFDRVTVIDRDRFPDGAKFRKGVPQSRHLHALLASGLQILEQLFPGLEAEWVAAGAVPIEWPRDMLVLTRRGWSDRFPTGIKILSASREFLEWGVRRRVAAFGNVRFLEGRDVTGLLADADRRRVEGLRIRARSSAAGQGDGHLVSRLCQLLLRDPSRLRRRLAGPLPPSRPGRQRAGRRAVPDRRQPLDGHPCRPRSGLPSHR